MKIFFDFDDFFFDTESEEGMVKDYFGELRRLTGASEEDIQETRQRFSGAGFVVGEVYSPERHIDFLRERLDFDSAEVKKNILSFFKDISRYCFEGTEDFLKRLNRNDIYLLTFGDEKFQLLKVRESGLEKYFQDVIATEGNKLDEIERIVKRDGFSSGETIVFADNRCGHFVGMRERGIVTIHLKRDTDKYSQDPCTECAHAVSDFDGLYKILSELSGETTE